MSFCKPCHAPFRKLIPLLTFTAIYTPFRRQNTIVSQWKVIYPKDRLIQRLNDRNPYG